MDNALIEFCLRSVAFMTFFLVVSYYVFKHIEKVKQKYGEPEDKNNYIAILRHYFFRIS